MQMLGTDMAYLSSISLKRPRTCIPPKLLLLPVQLFLQLPCITNRLQDSCAPILSCT